MKRLIQRLVVSSAFAAAACAQRQVPAAIGPVIEPRASWIIRAGEYLAEKEVCRSDRDQQCVLPASSPDQPLSVVVSIFLFPTANVETTYEGALVAGFIRGSAGRGYERHVNTKITPDQDPVSLTVVGRVVEQPGRYPLDIVLFAAIPGHTDPHQYVTNVAVTVSAAPSLQTASVRP